MAISHVYKLSQTTFMSQKPGMKHSWVDSAELFMLVLSAKGTKCDKEMRKHKADQEECGLHSVNIPLVVC